jgi:uncharacterized protein (DUF433 family)
VRTFVNERADHDQERGETVTKKTVVLDDVDPRFDVALYTHAEAARALDVPASTFAVWAKGYVRPSGGQPVRGDPVVTSFQAVSGRPSVPFVGLAEGLVVAAVRRAGVPLQRIRPALEVLAREIGLAHALASKALYTDGAELLFCYAQHHAPHGEAKAVGGLVVVRGSQRVFKPVIDDYLRRIHYGADGYAELIRLPGYERASVLADPTRSFGQPIFARGGARVSDVLDRFLAGDDIRTLTQEFGVPADEIEDVLRVASRRAA